MQSLSDFMMKLHISFSDVHMVLNAVRHALNPVSITQKTRGRPAAGDVSTTPVRENVVSHVLISPVISHVDVRWSAGRQNAR